ncbi:MAG: MerR family DNA-binding transcriptional regulator, partial [Firmicutes bacterium]|nr:MerR family DNA-binding transcriptional regulator [Bacillota bacterium]
MGLREAAEFLGVTPSTLRRWEREGKLIPDERTAGGYRGYDLARLRPEQFAHRGAPRKTVAYARVSSHDQKDDLERQKQVLAL